MFLVYLKLQLKRTFKMLPLLLLGTMLLFLLTGSIAFLSSKKLYSDSITKTMRLGVVYPKENKKAEELFINTMKEQSTLKKMTNFVTVEEDDGKEKLKKGELEALIIIPENFIKNIISGKNIPAKVILNENQILEAKLFKTLSEASSKSLSTSQAAIYALFDFYKVNDISWSESEKMNQEVNDKFLTLTLGRDKIFNQNTISATGQMDTLHYFFSSWMILFLLLMGMIEAFIMRRLNKGVNIKLTINGIGKYKRLFVDFIKLFILDLIFIGQIALLWYLASNKLNIEFTFTPFDVLKLFIIALSVSSFILFIYTLNKDLLSSMLSLFLISFFMLFYSGGFIPTSFLPKFIKETQIVIPTFHWMKLLGDFMLNNLNFQNIVISFFIFILFYVLSVLIVSFRKDGE